ncbi:hypothetical protein DM01DRAFT_1314518 [Hesseltinella vesiculosa]|uniref:FANCI solenoid 4 domain-containing protein n=1 Tax=Hesseltinella vesiculosa TaxID=101127 RepID=A0A1X2GXQ5_9FUNG|nr:hypothetical protein DM01DRAFT_1314518 [Hesseltinella vesiculosa]
MQQIHDLVRQKLTSPAEDADPILVMRALLLGAPSDAGDVAQQGRMAVVSTFLDWVGEDLESTNGSGENVKLATTIVNLLLPELEILSTEHLEGIGRNVLEYIENGVPLQPRVFDLLAKVHNLLSAMEATEMSSSILQNLCQFEWNPLSSVTLASCVNDLELSGPELDVAVKRLVRQIKELEIDEIPPFVYQLLILSRKGKRKEAVAGICTYFEWFDANHPERATSNGQSMQGTVMLHLSFAIKQDNDLGSELMKFLKNDKHYLLNTFKMACLLSISRIHRLESTIFDMLKSSIMSVYKDNDVLDKLHWVAEYTNMDIKSVRTVIMDIVDRSASGWDQVIQSTIHLALLLIDAASVLGVRNSDAVVIPQSRPKYADDIIDLGIEVIAAMFKLHDVVRAEILEQITSRVVSRSPSALPFLQLLSKVVLQGRGIPSYVNHVKYNLDFLSYLPLPIAKCLLSAVQPIAGQDAQFRDGLMLVLRKSIFARELDGRMISVHGLISMLQSQLDSIHSSSSTGVFGSEGVIFEILGLLRRCFNQQYEIRSAAYDGLGTLALKYDMIAGDIFESLYAQFLRYYKPDDPVPLDLQICLESELRPTLQEPIALLLSNLLMIVRHLTMAGNQHSVILSALSECKQKIESLTTRLVALDLEDYELDKTTNLDINSTNGQYHAGISSLLIGVLETTLEHEFLLHADSMESCQKILGLYKKRKAILTLYEDTAKEKGRKAPTAGSAVLSLEFSAIAIQSIFLQGDVQTPVRSLRTDLDFIHYLVITAGQTIDKAMDDKFDDGVKEKSLTHRSALAKVFFHILIHETSESTLISHQPKKGHSILSAIASTLLHILMTTHNTWPQQLHSFLLDMLSVTNQRSPPNYDMNRLIMPLWTELKRILLKYLNAETSLYKEAVIILQIISFLLEQLDRTGAGYGEDVGCVMSWLSGIMEDRPIQDVPVVKELFGLLISLSIRNDQLDIIKTMSNEIHFMHGDIQGTSFDSQAPPSNTFAIVNEKTTTSLATLSLSLVEEGAADMIWCIGRLKMSDGEDRLQLFEQAVCEHLDAYLVILSELTQAALTGPLAEQLIRAITKTYRGYLAILKHKLTTPKDIPQAFIKLVAKIGNALTTKMYQFLTTYGHQRQEEYESSSVRRKKANGKRSVVDMKEKKKIVRESKSIPMLIFVVEQFEQYLIKLSRKSKVDLMQYMKRSTSRDFQIKLQNFVAPDSSEDEGDDAPKSGAKRARLAETNHQGEASGSGDVPILAGSDEDDS